MHYVRICRCADVRILYVEHADTYLSVVSPGKASAHLQIRTSAHLQKFNYAFHNLVLPINASVSIPFTDLEFDIGMVFLFYF